MNAFRRWLTSPLGYVVITAASTLLLLAVAPKAFAEWGWLTYSFWMIPMLGAQSKMGRRCRVPRWLGGRSANA
jgi:hypothetical protein